MNKIEILTATKNDLSIILEIQKICFEESALRYNTRDIQPLKQILQEVEKEFNEGIFLKAVCDDKIIGSVRSYQKENTCYINKLIVLPDFQNQGIGRKLMNEIEKKFSVKRFELFTGFKDEKNIAFYQKLGYEIFNTKELSETVSIVFMEKIV
ncbi:MAG: hypothetical protein A2Y34_01695 [Spirochaetes bacterium GWC1_27_15]|nr:MAG: hypothetical protein A2Z98_17475 [Spirochaetes bacterium GWB1_27_13]OHD26647.1 MAG: hypothetical protein A2Y34_01695 [Spirochaetes bacterium GWC1_27_15]